MIDVSRGRLRRTVVLTAALAATLGATACSVDDDGKQAAVPSGKKIKIGFVNGNRIQFHMCLEKALQARAAQKGVEVVTANSAADPTRELANIDDMIVKKVDVIVVQTVHVDALRGGVSRANRAGIPIFLTGVTGGIDQSKILGAVVADVNQVGNSLGAWLAKDTGGRPAEVAVIGGAPGGAAELMTAAFKKSAGTKAKVVFEQPAFWQRAKAQDVAENLLQARPRVKYVFAHNEDMAFGAEAAFRAARRTDIKILSNGGTPEGVQAIKAGRFAVTVSNTPKDIGEMAVENVVGLLRKEPSAKKIDNVPQLVVTKANADKAPPYCAV
ncbi:sugar ABC transporter substrate-binding protein [Actinomadura sp. KC216]|uniref:sugar ABC transporter substrate-binding protein n=1 Tax=Actinomadura sp. KC216 TaxID=2530370 RepID=UPI001052AFCF|nr:sugar ABC transporter substrate-binding protein [Actinomadura sp. KC216]TDB85680.1 sugar ABC transporter substrate-binding protein [Actinomadura sp. KC216]